MLSEHIGDRPAGELEVSLARHGQALNANAGKRDHEVELGHAAELALRPDSSGREKRSQLRGDADRGRIDELAVDEDGDVQMERIAEQNDPRRQVGVDRDRPAGRDNRRGGLCCSRP
jgi:hypothetical protein